MHERLLESVKRPFRTMGADSLSLEHSGIRQLIAAHLGLEHHCIQTKYRELLHPTEPPTKLRIDASTVCQLRCEGCGFQKSGHRGLGGGFLSADSFRQLIDSNPQIERIELSNYGETFLNPELIDIMRIAFGRGVLLEAAMGVNFNSVTDEQLQALVDYRFSFISISIDGVSQESYAKYRIGGDFDRVISNIKRLQAIKKAKGQERPLLQWQYVINEYNELEVGHAKDLSQELGIPIVFKLNFMPSYQPNERDYLLSETSLDCLTREEWLANHHEPYMSDDCLQMFLTLSSTGMGSFSGAAGSKATSTAQIYSTKDSSARCRRPALCERRSCSCRATPRPQGTRTSPAGIAS